MQTLTIEEICQAEVEELHAFFEAWFRGEVDRDERGLRRVSSVLPGDFQLVSPTGKAVGRRELLEALWPAHGSRVEDPSFCITIADYRGRPVCPDVHLATYRESHSGRDVNQGRVTTAIFRRRSGTPNGVEWLHVHECWVDRE